MSELAHRDIDRLAGVLATARKPTDTVRECVFDQIENRLNEIDIETIRTYRHKFVAHAATEGSREKKNSIDFNISFRMISHAHEIICTTAAFIGNNLLGKSIVIPNVDDVFKDLDKPLVVEEDMGDLSTQWDKYRAQTKKWGTWDWDSDLGSLLRKHGTQHK